MAKLKELENKARILRKHIIKMTCAAGSGHPGGSLSAADIVAALYFHELRLDPSRPDWPDRDRFVLSKGHAAPVLYAALAERGFFPVEELLNLRKLGSRLQGHPVASFVQAPGVEANTGSLGQGLSVAQGMALAARLEGASWRTYCMLGDGEMQEGQVWEALQCAHTYELNNFFAIIDVNNLQIDGHTWEVSPNLDFVAKLEAFGYEVIELDGHDTQAISDAFDALRESKNGKPKGLVLNTIKGKGVSYMEDQAGWHGKAPNTEQYEQAMAELEKGLDQ